MAAFTDEDFGRLDWRLLQKGSINLYWRAEILREDVARLQADGYRAITFDCLNWTDEMVLHHAFETQLNFPDYYGRNLNALNDCLKDVGIGNNGETGLVLVFERFDIFTAIAPKTAWHVLDILEDNSRRFSLLGQRLISLVQTNDSHASYEPLGARPAMWNPREWLNKNRGV